MCFLSHLVCSVYRNHIVLCIFFCHYHFCHCLLQIVHCVHQISIHTGGKKKFHKKICFGKISGRAFVQDFPRNFKDPARIFPTNFRKIQFPSMDAQKKSSASHQFLNSWNAFFLPQNFDQTLTEFVLCFILRFGVEDPLMFEHWILGNPRDFDMNSDACPKKIQ